MRYTPSIPQNIGELMDKLGSMTLGAPTFKDRTGYFAQKNIDTEFCALNEGLQAIRKTLGEEQFATLRAISGQMRALFESDPDNTNGGTKAGQKLILEMEDILEKKERGST